MKKSIRREPFANPPWAWACLGSSLLFAACSGASSSADAVGSATGPFQLSSLSVSDGATWRINRPIRFTFSVPVEFDSVNLNTIQVQRPNGAPALGEFHGVPGDPRTVVFQPACPRLFDYSDAGFLPGGTLYRVHLPTGQYEGATVRSVAGKPLSSAHSVTFKTPSGTEPSVLFLDTLPGAAQPVIAQGAGTLMRVNGAELYFDYDGSGSGVLPEDYEVPNNFYSDVATQVAFHLRFDQPVNPAPENISSERLRLEYELGGAWRPLESELLLESNCVGTGASVRVTPVGVLPQGRPLRLAVSGEFEDLVGETTGVILANFAKMNVGTISEDGVAVETADEFLESFDDSTWRDSSGLLGAPAAEWGAGELEAGFAFEGTGGPAGVFDLKIAENSVVVFDTTYTRFRGGPGFATHYEQDALNGVLQVRDLEVPASSTLLIQGPNAAKILATGDVLIEGRISVNGSNATPVFTLNTPFQPESGGSGQGGGGDGGVGSFLTTQVTPRGGNGEGPYGAANLGGSGGEAGWSNSPGVTRRGGGGGGGVLGHDQVVDMGSGIYCPEQTIYGLDGESGFPGVPGAQSSQGAHTPWGGPRGAGPFGHLPGVTNDFWGRKIRDFEGGSPELVTGELTRLTPGSGGGAGGDSTYVPPGNVYPPANLINNHNDKGAGGGGGAGALSIFALGDIAFGPAGRITAVGGFGTGGENIPGADRIGGGSGGGSGGHIVLQSAGRVDFSRTPPLFRAIDARGGQGGEGAGGLGGANNSELAVIMNDAKHIGANNGVDNPWEFLDPVCFAAQTGTGVVVGAGGDGGPGLVQIHVEDLDTDIIYASDQSSVYGLSRPVPHGYNANTRRWVDHLLPSFGRVSSAQSKWIPFGEADVDPVTEEFGPLALLFGGTDPATGRVSASAGVVDRLDVILEEDFPRLDEADPTGRSLLMDSTAWVGTADEIYRRNPELLRYFELEIGVERFTVSSARREGDDIVLGVSESGPSLAGALGAVGLRPRYVGISTNGIRDSLPASTSIRIEFDLKAVHPENSAETSTTGFVPNLAGEDFEALGIDRDHIVRYLRYRVSFDIDALGTGNLSAQSPRPRLEFLRLPFRF